MSDLPAKSTQEVINRFQKQIQNLFEVEYGDFKRKVGLYLEQLEQGLVSAGSSAQIRNEVFKIRQRVVYDPMGDIESARQALLTWTHTLH